MINIIRMILAVCLSVSPWPLCAAHAQGEPVVKVRVAILDDADSVRLVIKSGYGIYVSNSSTASMQGSYLSAVIKPSKGGIRVGSKDIRSVSLRIRALKDGNIYINSRRFRGDIDVMRKDNGKLILINRIDIEEYLYGVLYHEVSHRWPMEALKSQAIAARTFALYEARRSRLQPYDLRSDVYSQMYGGKTSEKWSTTRAVDLTKGKVLSYKGGIFPAYYHATCAGRTEDASNLWNIDLPVMKGVGCDFCAGSPHYNWERDIPLGEAEEKLRRNGYKVGRIVSVSVLSRNVSGRVDKVEIKDDKSVSCILTGKDFRQMFGPDVVRSTNFNVEIKWNHLVVKGKGWGHGVGMCQWGAFGQSTKGKKAEDILKYYYPGAEITTIDKLPAK